MRTHAAELVAPGPDIILAHSSAALAPLLQVTRTVPIVFTIVADPVGAWVPLLRLRATHYHTVAQERCCASQQKLRADVAVGSKAAVRAMPARVRTTSVSGPYQCEPVGLLSASSGPNCTGAKLSRQQT
jgi:hypothetical protein